MCKKYLDQRGNESLEEKKFKVVSIIPKSALFTTTHAYHVSQVNKQANIEYLLDGHITNNDLINSQKVLIQ